MNLTAARPDGSIVHAIWKFYVSPSGTLDVVAPSGHQPSFPVSLTTGFDCLSYNPTAKTCEVGCTSSVFCLLSSAFCPLCRATRRIAAPLQFRACVLG